MTVGFLVADNRSSARPIDPREHELLEMLADSLAVAIRNSRLYGEVAETKRSLEQLVRSAGDAIISIDRRGNITGWNPAAERIFGVTAEEAIGRSLRGMFPERYEQAARLALTGAQPVTSFDLSAKRPDGGALNLAVTLSGVPGRDGRVEGLLAIVRDMTSQRELETQMHQSEKLTALGQVAGGIAHDFNNLLQAILGYSQLMSKNMQNADVMRRGLSVIETAAAGGAETVRRIQKFARLRPDEPFVSVELNQVIQDAVAITRPRWEERVAKGGVPLRLDLRLSPLPDVMGRPSELNEVVTNLILNAIDAMPDGGTLAHLHAPRGRRARGADSRRHGRRHARAGAQAHLRPVLHHQGRGGHGAGALGVLLHHPAPRRRDARRERAGPRDDVHHRPAGRQSQRRRRRPAPRPS